jgi:hypothetical protein
LFLVEIAGIVPRAGLQNDALEEEKWRVSAAKAALIRETFCGTTEVVP